MAKSTRPTCVSAGCPNKRRRNGFCHKHFVEAWERGELLDVPSCSNTELSHYAPVEAQGLCSRCYQRKRFGIPLDKFSSGQSISYDRVHRRIAEQRGRASEYDCLCGEPAKTWACVGEKTLEEVRGGSLVRYSPNIEDYEPRCGRCARLLDAARGESHGLSKLTDAVVLELKTRLFLGEPLDITQEARQLGVAAVTLRNALNGVTWPHIRVDEEVLRMQMEKEG